MTPSEHLLAFVVIAVVLILVPGPSVLFVVARSLTLGRGGGLATAVGNAAGVYVQVVAVAFGLGRLVQESIAAGSVALQLLTLGGVFCLLALVCDSMWALAAGAARAWLVRSPRRLETIGGAGGVAMIGLGAGLVVSGRRE